MKPEITLSWMVSVLLILTLLSVPSLTLAAHQGPVPQDQQKDRLEPEEETIFPGPKDIKEATGIYVILGWIWLLIGIVVFFLRLKIKEVDRLHDLGYFKEDKD